MPNKQNIESPVYTGLFATSLDPDIKLQKHIFIYSPCGRTSSTAFQRMLNSSNEICVWGEPFGFDTFILEGIQKLKKAGKVSLEERQKQYQTFLQSFSENSHDKFYPLAFQSFEFAIKALEDVFSFTLMPLNNAKRFGYKNIAVGNINILHTLRNIYPNCYLIFLFRNPLTQWVSIREVGFFPYSNDIIRFLDEYFRGSSIFIEYFNDTGHPIFIENKVLFDMRRLTKLLEYLEISRFDKNLFSKMVSSVGRKELPDEEKDRILASNAYKNYEKMLELADKF